MSDQCQISLDGKKSVLKNFFKSDAETRHQGTAGLRYFFAINVYWKKQFGIEK